MKQLQGKLGGLSFCLVLSLAGCQLATESQERTLPIAYEGLSDHPHGAMNSRLRLKLKDVSASAAYQSAVIEVVRVDLRAANGAWAQVPIEPTAIDLMQLGSEAGRVLAQASGPEAVFTQVRLITVDIGVVTYTDGTTRELRVPSGPQTGIKFNFNPGIELETCALTEASLEMDLSRSFVETAHSVHFKPVVHGVSFEPTTVGGACEDPEPTPTPSESPSPEPTPTPSESPSPEPTPTPSPSETPPTEWPPIFWT